MYPAGPWHLKLFLVVLTVTTLVMVAASVGYGMGYHWEPVGVLTLVAIVAVTLAVLEYRLRRLGPPAWPPPVAEVSVETPGGSPASLIYLVFGATTVAMVLVGLAGAVAGPWVVSGVVVASYLASRIVRGTRPVPVGSAGEGTGGGTGPHAHPPSLREQMARAVDLLGMVVLWAGMLYMSVALLWFTFAVDDTVSAAGTGMTVLAGVLQIEGLVWLRAHR